MVNKKIGKQASENHARLTYKGETQRQPPYIFLSGGIFRSLYVGYSLWDAANRERLIRDSEVSGLLEGFQERQGIQERQRGTETEKEKQDVGGKRIGWKWNQFKSPTWQDSVPLRERSLENVR